MTVIRTDKWLLDLYDDPIKLCKKMKSHFFGVQAQEIHDHLAMYGMYRQPAKDGKDCIRKMQENHAWKIIKKEKQHLQQEWNGPSIPVFIFPSDPTNRRIQREMGGKSGLTFHDKLFLFISENTAETDLKALFTHEYNHVCRLSNYKREEADYTLLDTTILEGLAENAVCERFGEEWTADWTRYYSDKSLEKLANNLILPNRNLSLNDTKHQNILYGRRNYPNMAGYSTGYYLVKKYRQANDLESKDLLSIDTERLAQIAGNDEAE